MRDLMDVVRIPSAGEINPTKFYALAELAQSIDPDTLATLDTFLEQIGIACDSIEDTVRGLVNSNNALLTEVRNTARRKNNPFDITEEEYDNIFSNLKHTASGESFLRVIMEVFQAIQQGYHLVRETAQNVRPAPVILVGGKVGDKVSDFQELQTLSIQMSMNEGAILSFMTGVARAATLSNEIIGLGRHLTNIMDAYSSVLLRRHSLEGIQVFHDPVTTDVAISIYENVDAHGEIQEGKDPDEVSAYSIRKAKIIADSIREGVIGDFLRNPDKLIELIQDNLRQLWSFSEGLGGVTAPLFEKVRVHMRGMPRAHRMDSREFERALVFLKDLDPQNVVFKEKTGLLSAEERHALEFRNHTLREITRMLVATPGLVSSEDVVQYVLERKKELREYELAENSFFVCKIGTGNPFSGEAPGMLTVVSGIKPCVDLSEVIGSGFAEVREFITQTIDGAKWFDLFVATSPSKKADKSNILLVGPMGCGKTEVLRAVASDRKSVGIFAQASDFLTCWKGEAEKNPKRLFEAGVKIQRESKKQVFFLIDEIDTILNGDRGQQAFGGTNLATEFQVLMDGITTYPHLAIWGATNAPERITMPLIRRFAKVIIVGELDQEERVALLKQFLGYLPLGEFPDRAWQDAARLLEGAVGDIIRKIVDHVWREKMGWLVANQPEEAETMVKMLNNGTRFDVAKFTSKDRQRLHARLSPFVQVRPKDLMDSINLHLDNFSIQNEIKTAVATYESARKFLSQMNHGKKPKVEVARA